MARVRIRCKLSETELNALSAVCASEIPSLALRAAWLRPLIWLVIRSEMARPAASSLALLIRKPEERRCSAVVRPVADVARLRWAFKDAILVLIIELMLIPLDFYLLQTMFR